MTVDFNIVDSPKPMYDGVKHQGYTQISETQGIKTAGNMWWASSVSLADLKNSEDWQRAKYEYDMQHLAWSVGLAPEPYALNVVQSTNTLGSTHYHPCLWMEHVGNMTLRQAYWLLSADTHERIHLALAARLLYNGISHEDLHLSNIVVSLPDNRAVERVWAIDFEYCSKLDGNLTIAQAKEEASSLVDYHVSEYSIATFMAAPDFGDDPKWYGNNHKSIGKV